MRKLLEIIAPILCSLFCAVGGIIDNAQVRKTITEDDKLQVHGDKQNRHNSGNIYTKFKFLFRLWYIFISASKVDEERLTR